jgi:plastocyanin
MAALAVAGCSSAGGTAGEAASPVATTSVDLPKSYRFEPAAITVDAGSTVTWTNHDNFSHNVRFEGAEPLVMKPGESVQRTFDAPGTFRYECSFHPQDMQGTVVVGG